MPNRPHTRKHGNLNCCFSHLSAAPSGRRFLAKIDGTSRKQPERLSIRLMRDRRCVCPLSVSALRSSGPLMNRGTTMKAER